MSRSKTRFDLAHRPSGLCDAGRSVDDAALSMHQPDFNSTC